MSTSTSPTHVKYVEAKNDLKAQVKYLSTVINWILSYQPYDPQMAIYEYFEAFSPNFEDGSSSKVSAAKLDLLKWIAWTLRPQSTTDFSDRSAVKISQDQMIIQAYLYPTFSNCKLPIASYPSCLFSTLESLDPSQKIVNGDLEISESEFLATFQTTGWTRHSLRILVQCFKLRWERLNLCPDDDDQEILGPVLEALEEGEYGEKVSFDMFQAICKYLIGVQGYLTECGLLHRDIFGGASQQSLFRIRDCSGSQKIVQELCDQLKFWQMSTPDLVTDPESNQKIFRDRISALIIECFSETADAAAESEKQTAISHKDWTVLWRSLIEE